MDSIALSQFATAITDEGHAPNKNAQLPDVVGNDGDGRSLSASMSSGSTDRGFSKDLRRDLEEHHVNMISFSACIGVGLFLQSGRVISLAGPGMGCICYVLCGTIMWSAMACLGEMTALFPVKGPIFTFQVRFLDESIGYAAAYMTWFSWTVILATEILTIAQLFTFEFVPEYLSSVGYPDNTLSWPVGENVSPAVWIGIFLITVGLVNLLPVLVYGWLEYVFGFIKMLFIVGLILFCATLSSQKIGLPSDTKLFWTWDPPYGFISQNFTLETSAETVVLTSSLGQLAGVISAMTTIMFSVIGFETVAITAAENKDLERNETIKLAARKVVLRIIVLYTFCCFLGGLNVPIDDMMLQDSAINSIRSGSHSIFVLAAVRAKLRGWPSFFNGFFMFSGLVSGMNSLYNSSRTLHALACEKAAWPLWCEGLRWRLERTTHGVPYGAVFASWLIGLLAFMGISQYPSTILGYIATNSTVSMLIVYVTICASYLRFYKAIGEAAKGRNSEILHLDESKYDRDHRRYPYRSHGQWLRAWYGLIGCAVVAIFNGWESFVKPFNVSEFFASYIPFLAFIVIAILYHFKLQGSPAHWSLAPTNNLSNPIRVDRAQAKERRGHFPRLKKAEHRENLARLSRWLWTWLK